MDGSSPGFAGWRNWDADTWGESLFRYYFVTAGDDSRPVSRITLGTDELVEAAGLTGVDASEVRESFLNAIRCDPYEFRWNLSRAAVFVSRERSIERLPSYLPYLLFTCFAATSLDRETVAIGDFRKRLRALLEHPSGTSYPLGELPDVWEDLRAWLADRRRAGAPYRELILPDPDWMTRIGYSIGLAFPMRRDRIRLQELVREANWQDTPTVDEALQAIGRRVDQFSKGFQGIFREARRAFVKGANLPELQALWSAILEAIASAAILVGDRTSGIRYQLVLRIDAEVWAEIFLLASRAPDVPTKWFEFTPLDDPIGENEFLVQRRTDQGILATAHWVLSGGRSGYPPGLQHGPMMRTIQDGVLLFQRGDVATWELMTSRPAEGEVRALVASRICRPLLEHFGSWKPIWRESKIEGWMEFDPFDIGSLPAVTPSTAPLLAGIRCLQATSVGSRISLSDGIRVENGYLGLRDLLPVAHCAHASGMELYRVPSASSSVDATWVAELSRHGEPANIFGVPDDAGDLAGAYRLMARGNQGTVISSREVMFHTRVLGHAFKRPSDGSQWTVEAAGPAILSADEGVDCFLETESTTKALSASDSERLPGHDGVCPASAMPPRSVDDDPRLDRFVEALAASFANRRGMDEADVLDLLRRIVGVDDRQLGWDVLRGWVEAGYLDCLARRRWWGRIYFGRRPRLITSRLGQQHVVVLHGLAPYRLRVRARAVFAEMGARPLPSLSMSRLVGSPQSWVVQSNDASAAAAKKLELGPPEFARRACEFLWTRDQIIEQRLPDLPRYELQGCWDWSKGGFRGGHHSGTTSSVRIERHRRADRPDLFVVRRDNGEPWATHVRNWALVIGYAWANVPALYLLACA